jgi:hypothetical protein
MKKDARVTSPIVGAVHVAGPKFGCQKVAFTIEQQQGMIPSGLEMSVVDALLLVAIDRDLGAVIERFGLRDQLPVNSSSPVLSCGRSGVL